MGRVGLGLVGVGEGLGFEILGVDGLGLVVEGLVDLGGATAATGAANVAAAEPTMTGWVIATWRSPAGLCSTRLSGGPWRIGTSTAHFLAARPSPNSSAATNDGAGWSSNKATPPRPTQQKAQPHHLLAMRNQDRIGSAIVDVQSCSLRGSGRIIAALVATSAATSRGAFGFSNL